MSGKPAKSRFPQPLRAVLGLRARAWRFLSHDLWRLEGDALSRIWSFLVRALRIGVIAVRGLMQNDCSSRAAALTYTTVLSLVPLLAFCFAVAKGVADYDRLMNQVVRPRIDAYFEPGKVQDVIHQLLDAVDRTNASQLGVIGLLSLLYTALQLLGSVETALNQIWGVRGGRSLWRQLRDFIALLIVGPLLLVVAVSVAGAAHENAIVVWIERHFAVGPFVGIALKATAIVATILAFAFLYWFFPSIKVRFGSALFGGLVGGLLWQALQIIHVHFQVGVAKYSAIYSGFAAVPIFLLWLYMSWMAVLLGAHLAWAHQCEPEVRAIRRAAGAAEDRESLAVRIVVAIADGASRGARVQTPATLAHALGVSRPVMEDLVAALSRRGLIRRDPATHGLTTTREPGETSIVEVLDAVREAKPEVAAIDDPIAGTLARLHAAQVASAANVDVADFLDKKRES